MEIRPHVWVLIALLPSWAPCPNQLRGEYSDCRSNLPGIDCPDLRLQEAAMHLEIGERREYHLYLGRHFLSVTH